MRVQNRRFRPDHKTLEIQWDDDTSDLLSSLIAERYYSLLAPGNLIEDSDLVRIRQENAYEIALKRAYDLLARKGYTSFELRNKLTQSDIPADTIRDVLTRLRQLDYLNDEKTLLDWALRQLQERPMGHLKLKQLLIRRAGQCPLVQTILRQAYAQIPETELIRHCLLKKYRQRPLADLKEKARAYRYLSSLGFRSDAIMQIMSSPFDEDTRPSPDDD
ncbi:MAG: regulatory protein RecX [Candidatus Delongbacteria bacterium]|nr:regulatory protein RecX [Candidatus Delongbacteria bacterium]